MKNNYKLILLAFFLISQFSFSQHTVVLRVIDNENGALTNKVDDNHLTNVFCWIGGDDYEFYTGDWWYAMYDGEARCPGGKLIIEDGKYIWQATFTDVPAGDYSWNPHMKTLGWAPINNLYEYSDGDPDLNFTVASDGTVTGITELSLPFTGFTTSVENKNIDFINVYTNNGCLHISGVNNLQIDIYDISGVKVESIFNTDDTLEISYLKKGSYLIVVDKAVYKVLL